MFGWITTATYSRFRRIHFRRGISGTNCSSKARDCCIEIMNKTKKKCSIIRVPLGLKLCGRISHTKEAKLKRYTGVNWQLADHYTIVNSTAILWTHFVPILAPPDTAKVGQGGVLELSLLFEMCSAPKNMGGYEEKEFIFVILEKKYFWPNLSQNWPQKWPKNRSRRGPTA